MSLKTSCPGQIHLRRFLLGQASRTEAASVEEHLQHCERCRAIVAGFKAVSDLECTLGDAPLSQGNGFNLVPEVAGKAAPPAEEATIQESQRSEAASFSGKADGQPVPRRDGSQPEPDCTLAGEPSQFCQPQPPAGADQTGSDGRTDAGPADHCTLSFGPGGPAPSMPSFSPSDAESVVIPGYEILGELGRGGMGVVYKARHLGLRRFVALKMLLAGAHAGTAALVRFRLEAEAVAQLQHPNIVQIYETGEHKGHPYFSLEFIEGGSLDQRVKESPLLPRAAAELVEILARTMDVAHERGIVHRDLKPGNILIQKPEIRGQKSELRTQTSFSGLGPSTLDFCPKIADFGLAKKVNSDSTQTQAGAILGTPSYMAPEQAEGKNDEIGPAADTYSLGAILYDLLVGRPPFKAGNPIDTIRQVIEQEPVPPRQLEPRVPPDLETICLKCLEKEPARRYSSAAELADDLRRFLDDKPILARPTPAWERAWKWGKRRPAIVAMLGIIVAAIAGMVLFIVWHNVSLQEQLVQARADERLAQEREQEALEGERLVRVEAEGSQLLQNARVSAAARDWTNARLHLTKALATIGAEPGLDKLKEPARVLLKQAEQELRAEADRRASQARFQQFVALRDEAQFLGTLYTGIDLHANLKATRETVQQALAVYSVSVDAAAPQVRLGSPDLPGLDASQKAEVLGDCYQLLLILAETEAQSSSEKKPPEEQQHLREALRLLEQALRFGAPSRAYHLRRARYLELLRERKEAVQAEQAATAAAVVHVLDHFLVADEYYRRGEFDKAMKEFDEVLRRKPAHFWAQYLNALCLLRQHRPGEAKAQLGACLAQRPDFVWLYLLRGFAQSELKAFDGAEADFQQALKLPLDAFARYALLVNRGVLRVGQNRLGEAIDDLKTAIELKPKEYQAHVNLAQAYRARKDLDLALEQLHRAIQLEPKLASVYRLRARLYLERMDPDHALKDFEQAIQSEYTNSTHLADDYVELGRLLLRERKYAASVASFDAALRLRKDHSRGQRLRAEALFHLGRYQEVIEAFDLYLEKGKPRESVYRGRGLAKAELGKYPGAIEDYTRALELEPTSVVQAYRGWAHLVCDAQKLALRDFQLAIDLDATNADAYTGRGLVLASQGKQREAVRDAEAAVRHGPQTARLLYNAARIHAQCGDDSEQRTLELIRKALDLLPPDQRASFWSTYIRKDAALQAIRRNSQFLRLQAEMTQRQ